MSGNNSAQEGSQEKGLPETAVQTVPQNLTTIQSIQTVQSMQSVQNPVSSGIQSIQTAQAVTGQAATIVGKSISLELNSKLIMKPSIQSSIGTSSENSKITTSTFCPVGSTVRLITPSMLSTIERQTPPQVQQTTQQAQQIVTSIPSTYHVPRGPAAVANISTPRATLATPLVRAINTGPISRAGIRPINIGPRGSPAVVDVPTSRVATSSDDSPPLYPLDFSKRVTITKTRASTTSSTTQWQPKTTSVVYAPQRHSVPVVNRQPTRPIATTVYTGQQQPQPQSQSQQQQQQQQTPQQSPQPRLMSPSQIGVGRPVQATVVTATPPRLIAPVLQAQNNSITRLPAPTRPQTPQVTNIAQVSQAGRPVGQTIQPNQTSRPLGSTPINRIAVSAPVIGTPNRVATVTSVQTSVGRQLTINTAAGTSTSTVNRIVLPQQSIQQQQQQQTQGTQRILQTVTPLANFSQVSRVIATTSGNAAVAANVTRVAQTGPTSVARITGMSLHPLPLTPARVTPTPLKVTAQASGIQTVQLKQTAATIQPQPPTQQQPQQQQPQQQGPTTLQRTIGISSANVTATSVTASQQPAQVQGQYLHQPHTTTFYSIEPSGTYSQYRQTSVQPVRLLVEQGYEEPLTKPNASPRPSILRKRDPDSGSPVKGGVAKNLVPVLASLPAISSVSSPPSSPKGDRDGGGNHSSGSTTVSATSSPGLDEEPEQRIPMNPTVEMSPRKKPRKQQLAGVELTESRSNEEEMQFITEEKIKKEVKEEPKDKYSDRKHVTSNSQQESKPSETTPKSRPSMLQGSSWKARWGGSRLHHYRRPTDVRPREERRPTVTELAQQKDVLQKCNGWKVHHLTTQMEELADLEKSVNEKLKTTLTILEPQMKGRRDDNLERAIELIKGNMQRSTLISEGMVEARTQLKGLFQHQPHVTNMLQSCINKRAPKKRDHNK